MALTSEKTRKKLYVICLKPIKKMLKVYKSLSKVTNALIVKMQLKKISFKKFFYFKKILDFHLSKCFCKPGLQSAKYLLTKCHFYF